MGKVELVSGREMTKIYEVLSEINPEEIQEAVKQKNMLKKEHVFDVLSARGKINYRDIYFKLETMCEDLVERGKVYFEDNGSNIEVSEGSTYYKPRREDGSHEGTRIEVRVDFIPILSNMEASEHPTVILPKNEYHDVLARRDRGGAFGSVDDRTFTFEDIIEEALIKNVSDVHITYSENYYYVSYREDGDLVRQPKFLLSKEAGTHFLKKVKQDASKFTKGSFNADEHELAQGARIEFPKLGADTRLAFTPKGTLTGENALTTRILKKQSIDKENFSFANMGYDQDFVELLELSSHMSSGLILVAGITGSGKSTLLSHFTVQLPTTKRIMTFEDPIEYAMEGSHITQHQRYIPSDSAIAFDFSDGIKSSKRSDPDIIYIGEIRKDKGNNDLIESVIESAKAGQLVLSTVHINSAFDIYRSMDTVFGVTTDISSDLLLLTINQILVKKLCPQCKIKDTDGINKSNLSHANDNGMIRYAYKKDLEDFLNDETVETYIRNKEGCPHCSKGILGRKPIYEFLKPDVEFVSWLAEGNFERFKVEERACSQNKKFLAKNKLTNYVEALRRGEVDTGSDVMDKLLS